MPEDGLIVGEEPRQRLPICLGGQGGTGKEVSTRRLPGAPICQFEEVTYWLVPKL